MNTPSLQRTNTLLVFAGLAALLLGVLIYLPGLPGDFVFDDFGTIVDNPALHDVHAGLMSLLLSAPVGGLLRPISTLSFVLDARLFGFAPLGFKATNIAIHLAAGIMFWLVAREVLRAYVSRSGKPTDPQAVAWLSLAAATLWLVHPLDLTSVLYAVQRDNSLSAIFTAAAVLCYLIGRRQERETGGGTLLVWLAPPVLMVLGMLCKENAVLTPVLLLVIEFTLLDFRGRDGKPSWRARGFFLIFLLLPLLLGIGLMIMRPNPFFGAYQVRDFTLYQRLLSECRFLLDYLRWIFVPDLSELGLFHDDLPASRGLLDPWTTLPSVLVVIGLVAAGIRWRRRFPLLSLGILWFFAAHLLESTILPLELVFEHRNYLPAFGLILGLVGTLYPAYADPGQRRLLATGLMGCVALLAVTTAMRAGEWSSELSFARNEAMHHPRSARAQSEVQWAYTAYILASHDASLVPQAVAAAERSKADDPGSINQDVGLAYMFAALDDLPKAQQRLQSAATRALTAQPDATLQLALQTLLQLDGEAQAPLQPDIRAVFRAVLDNPAMARSPCYHGQVWNTYAVFQESTQQIPDALSAWHQAVTLCPTDALMRVNFAELLLRFGDTKDAAVQIEALAALHDLHYLSDLDRLRQEYAEAAAHPKVNVPVGRASG